MFSFLFDEILRQLFPSSLKFFTFFFSLNLILGQVKGKDDDSEYNQNNFFYFGGGGGEIVVMATGDVVLTRNCSDGETFSGIGGDG